MRPLFTELGKVIVGQTYLVERLVVGLLANGHVLLEGVPGLAKTLSVKTLANCLNVKFSRLQFTPDMLPADVVGTQIYNPQSGAFTTRKGPIFANLVLADEINRAPAKVQSALLEAMQEKQVTIGEQTFKLEEPFLVLATQNPIEQEGTYPLPEAQVDRFMLKLKIGYPSRAEERQILDLMARTTGTPATHPVVEPKQILDARQVINDIYMDDKVKDYIVDLVCATREPEAHKIHVKELIQLGASPRATISLTLAAKAYAFLQRPRLCHAPGCEEHRHGCAAPPRRHHLRSRSRGEDQRDDHPEDLRRIAGAMMIPGKSSKRSGRSRFAPTGW